MRRALPALLQRLLPAFLPVLLGAATVDPAIREKLDAGFSGDRERGTYALLRFHDRDVRDDREIVQRTFFAGTSIERAAALRGLCDRAPGPRGLSTAEVEWIVDALAAPDVGMRIAAIECLERLLPPRSHELRLRQLEEVPGRGLAPAVSRAILRSIVRQPAPLYEEVLARYGTRLELKSGTQFTEITADGAWLLTAMAAHGMDVEPLFSGTLELASETDDTLRARLNRIRAAGGDGAALSALVETANVAFDRGLRREAVERLLSLPWPDRVKAVEAMSSRMDDVDGPLRALLVRELSREAAEGGPAWEAMLVRALSDPFPDLRLQAAAGLFDRRAAGRLSDGAIAAARAAAAGETDPLARAAFRALLAE